MKKQKGVVLVVCLLILLIISIIGLSSIGTTKLEEQMASNAQDKNRVFQSAETAVEQGMSDLNFLGEAFRIKDDTDPIVSQSVTGGNVSNNYVEAEYIGCAYGYGSSIKQGSGFIDFRFDITGTGELTGGTGRSVHVRGAGVAVPDNQDCD